jgi:signal transduction histidine kinase/CheY-like chemotaxis protein
MQPDNAKPDIAGLSFDLPADMRERGILVLDPTHRISYVDPGVCRMLHVEQGDLLDKDRAEVIGEILKVGFKDADGFEAKCRWLKEHPHEVLEHVLELVKPERRILHWYSAPIFGDEGAYLGRAEVYSDITKRRQLEASVREAYEELKATQDQLVQSEKLRAIGEIASGVAHDFNNTLGIILGNIQLLVRNIQDASAVSRLQAIERAALDAVETVRRIQEFTKIKADEPFSCLDLSVLAGEVVEVLRPAWHDSMEAQGSHIEVKLDLHEGAYAMGIAAEIREVLANIILNAVQSMPSGGRIEVSTGRSEESSRIRISDTGIGMTEDVQKRIFDPFFTTRGVEGTGLGMSVAYGIISRHKGAIGVQSEPGQGTTITVSLPAVEAAPESEDAAPTAEDIRAQPAKILVVDDEEAFAQVMVEMLTECGHAVCVARSGREAIERFEAERHDLVFTDLGMPGMSGWDVARAIKSMEPGTPVVLLTGWGKTISPDEMEGSQIDMVLSKPVNMDHLSAIVSEALSRKH